MKSVLGQMMRWVKEGMGLVERFGVDGMRAVWARGKWRMVRFVEGEAVSTIVRWILVR